MRASQAPIVFPALVFHEGDDLYYDLSSAEDLLVHLRPDVHWAVDGEIVDSSGHRFLIRCAIEVTPIEPSSSGWRRWRQVMRDGRRYRWDFELEPLPPEAFAETFRRVLEKEGEQEAYHIMEGGGPDTEENKEALNRCRSIADIIEHNNTIPPGSPRTATESFLRDLRDWWRSIWRGR